jgi:acyl carrier protein
MNSSVLQLIERCTREIGEEHDVAVPGDLDAATRLIGRQGLLDSLALVSLVIAVEEALEDEFGLSVSLADERAMSQIRSPFRSIGTLAEYVSLLIEEAA